MEAIGGKDKQLAELVDASNAVFATFAKEDADFKRTLHLLPGALEKTGNELAKVTTASNALGSTLTKLQPFAKALAPAQIATKKLSLATTPIIKNEIRPFAREILPVVNELAPSTEGIAKAFPKLTVTFGVLNEFFNELAYNPGPEEGRLPVLPRLGQPRPQQRRQQRRRQRAARAQPRVLQLRSAADPQRRGRSEPDGEPARRSAAPADQGRMPGSRV